MKLDSGDGRKAISKDLQERIETFPKASSRKSGKVGDFDPTELQSILKKRGAII